MLPAAGTSPVIDLQTSWSLDDLDDIDDLLPERVLSPKLREWLNDSLRGGSIRNGRFTLRGDLSRFPFSDGDGEFSASAEADAFIHAVTREGDGRLLARAATRWG